MQLENIHYSAANSKSNKSYSTMKTYPEISFFKVHCLKFTSNKIIRLPYKNNCSSLES